MKLNVIPSSPTLAINALANQKKANGERVFNLSAGEPMIAPHPAVVSGATEAILQGKTWYTPSLGIVELRTVAAEWMNTQYQTNFAVENTAVTNGGKFGLYALCRSLLNLGDEAIVIAPYWTSYPSLIEITGAQAVIVNTEQKNNWKITPAQLRAAITAKTRVIFFNNAGNPTGTLYSREELHELLAIAVANNIIFISDEVYSGLTYEQEFYSAASFPEFHDQVIVIQSVSKHFAMTGWRVGIVFANQEIITAVGDWQSQLTSGTATVSQYAALAAFNNSSAVNGVVKNEMHARRDCLVKNLQEKINPRLVAPAAGLYMFVSLVELGVEEWDDQKFCEKLLSVGNIATVPGSAFGAPGFLRLSFGASIEELELAVTALANYLKK